jgi:outer membrane receptor for ferrienterochelin and colicins
VNLALAAALPMFGYPVCVFAQDAVQSTLQATISSGVEPRIENGRQIYDAAQFVQFTPQTGNDIIARIPGFNITDASNDRGLGEATQNVLFNGQRISGKSNDARTVLGRTPASNIIRVEIADGSVFNIPGLTGQVANIVTKTTGITGNFLYRSQIRKTVDPQYFTAEIGIAGKLGKGDFTLGLKNEDNSYRGGGTGTELTSSADGTLLYTNARINKFSGDTPALSGSYSRKSDAGSVFNSNAELYYSRERRLQTYARTTPGAADIFDLSTGKGDTKGFEVSADYEFALAGGKLKLIGLQTLSRTTDINGFRREFADGQLTTASIFDQIYKEGESVARAEYRWKAGAADWQISAEGAYNFLDVQSKLFNLDSAGVFNQEDLDDATSQVAEKRGQLIASYGRPLAKTIILQTQLGGEYSQISQTGARGLTRQFVRPKGLVSLAWKASPRLDVSARFERKVGQLNFGDFVASVDLRDANDNAGNVRLVPPQSWLASLEFNRNLKTAGSIKLKLEREWISDIIDQVAIEGGGEAPGNLDSASRWSAEVNATILLDPIGLKGMKFDLSGYLQRGRLRDQLFGFYRPINSERRYTYEVNFRHDIQSSPLAYGVILDDARNAPFLRLNFSSQEGRNTPNLRAYVEHKNIFGLRGRFAIINILNNKETYRQVFYTPRRDGDITQIRNGRQGSGVFARFVLSGTF